MNLSNIKNKIGDFFKKIISGINRISKKMLMLLFIIILVIIVIITIIAGSINKKKNEQCKELYNNIDVVVLKYLEQKDLFPTIQGLSVTVDLTEIEPVYFKNKQVTGQVKYTKYNSDYIRTYYLENCKYCSKKEFGKETDKYDKKKNNMDVVVYYNYYDTSYYNSYWTSYIEPEDISEEETMGVRLPLDSKKLPTIPADAQIVEYLKEDKTYYSYRDVLYKFYKNNIPYSDFSSEQPGGYTNKDENTVITSLATDWSLDYPEVKSYRTINKKTGYRWYYLDGKEKIYWQDGAYYPTQPDEKYNKKDKQSVTMYSYTDKMWKWYNGTVKRNYSSYVRVPGKDYLYKDTDLYKYTNWTSFKDTSSMSDESRSYREEVSKPYSRYMIKYRILSFAKLEKPVTQQKLEELTGRSIEDLMSDKNIYVDATFKFKY